MIEDPFHLQKDTRVFILTSPLKDSHIIAKDKLRNQFKAFGYSPTIQNYPTVQQVNDPDWSFNLPVKESDVGMNGVLQWYAYWAVLLKARKLRKHFIVAFSSVSYLEKDMPRSRLISNKNIRTTPNTFRGVISPEKLSTHTKLRTKEYKTFPNCYVYPFKIQVLDHKGAQYILSNRAFLKGTPESLIF
jgi:hypothetical protein